MVDFNSDTYKQILEQALHSKYSFLPFEEGVRITNDKKICLLRHDIDADLEAAVKMAQIENSFGIKATYFLMLRSPVYNLFSRFNHRYVQRLAELGHHIGLHYDGSFLPAKNKVLNEWIHQEASIIENMFGVKITTVSFHQPNEEILSNEIKITGLLNTYDKEDLRNFHYISDSNKQWKTHHPLTIFKENIFTKLHLLIHPMWWMQSNLNLPTNEVWDLTLLNNWDKAQQQLIETERAYGNKRKFKIEYDGKKY